MHIPPQPQILHYFCFWTGNHVVPTKTKFVKFVLKPLLKGNELPIPLCTHNSEEGLTYPTVHSFETEYPTVAILQMRTAAYPTVHPAGTRPDFNVEIRLVFG